ncbi:PAS domain-containing protein [bacterium]|nr:PAS domain-containing protein [bacterium]
MECQGVSSSFGSAPDRYERVFRHSADALFLADAAGMLLEINPAAARLLGIDSGVTARSLPGMIAEPAQRADLMRRLQTDGLVREGRVGLEARGTVIDALITAAAIHGASGAIEAFIGSIRDVTLETQTCSFLADMARFPAEDPNPVMRVSEAGVLIYANTASAPLLDAWSIQVGQALPWEPLEQVRRSIAAGRTCEFELMINDRAWMMICARVPGRRYVNLYGLDVTARRDAENEVARQSAELARANEQLTAVNERLNQQAKRLELIVRGIGDGVIVTDLEHRVTMMNHVARELLEVSGRTGTGGMLMGLLGDCTPPPLRFREMLEACRPDQAEEILLVLREPCPRTLRVVASAWVDPTGRVAGRVLILRDVTREREIDRLKTDFVGSVSHELRTPLTSIKGFTKALREDGAMDESLRNQFLDIIDQETLRLEALIEDLLEISRLESGRLRLERRPVDIAGLIESSCAMLSPMIEASALDLKLDIDGPLPLPIGDHNALQRMLVNILGNAIKFTPAGGAISVSASAGDQLTITVADTGIGIPQTDLPHIFERFYRVHRPGMEIAGTGLGLAIVHEIVQRHGGAVNIESELGHGTKVTVDLPVERELISGE